MGSLEEEDEIGILGLILLEERAVVAAKDLVIVRDGRLDHLRRIEHGLRPPGRWTGHGREKSGGRGMSAGWDPGDAASYRAEGTHPPGPAPERSPCRECGKRSTRPSMKTGGASPSDPRRSGNR